jgi:hypothetical protein
MGYKDLQSKELEVRNVEEGKGATKDSARFTPAPNDTGFGDRLNSFFRYPSSVCIAQRYSVCERLVQILAAKSLETSPSCNTPGFLSQQYVHGFEGGTKIK